jgi:hypothetical protein
LEVLVPVSLSPEQRSQRARIAALTRWSHEDPATGTQKAREGFYRRFEDEVDPDRQLNPAERERRAAAARKAFMARLAYRSAKARAERAAS